MPDQDDNIKEYYLIPHEIGLEWYKVLNGVSEAIDLMQKQIRFLSICRQDRTGHQILISTVGLQYAVMNISICNSAKERSGSFVFLFV